MSKKITIGLLSLFLSTQIAVSQQTAKAQIPVTPTTTTKTICPAQLKSAVDSITNSPEFSRVRWGILVKNLADEQTLYHRDAEKYFNPASNTKLLTTAAALQQLGADFRIRTSVYQDGDRILRVVGRGDPSLKVPQLQELAQQLRQQGITQVNQLIADDSYLQGETVHPSWEWEDLGAYYGAPVNSLIVNENASLLTVSPQTIGKPLQLKWNEPLEAYQWLVENNSVTTPKDESGFVAVSRGLKGPVLRIQGQMAVNSTPNITAIAVFDPVQNFLRHFRQTLVKEGISVSQMSNGTSGKNERELAAVESPPLSELLKETNINSNNLYAEALLRALAKQPLENNQTTADAGLEVVKTTLTKLGVDPTSYILVDGSGLSRKNLISPQALVQTLEAMAKSPQAELFRASLPVAGVSGTLTNRLRDTPAVGIVQAKTGTMTGVVSLSGYVNSPNYQPLAFSIIVNHSEQPARVVRQSMDEIVVLLTQLGSCRGI
ncbi:MULTISPECIES: D-alanyl-D-alanine carboxypeptidase/D-alanyl-D-alanine-endopeptidase [unclassified Nodularia (in: cyanobacteria)]|uniref:D-alanyl-D-alanine carboxypeptidase/D-alanyl-D-alanine endopeptidase n=1 Tax=unclassified Nodularia (in: cyanobacteria) TaxID=2656917 RepID=UPI001880CD2D|nr:MULTISPECIES: D-alanyl-D-alanine carboxypeptidase/D-alanyl-D-alanine-endopeptidase [unclassified Nodularia (in: cyanobacteria)]MBE9199750.1 D-alanyl-D-alanine carboxypeptidase/D-alanyl-D-alanine-endopeptidase [Nodularia sp. LEGE 06071]MCC2693348.1 D-alanyl-D-alanine carboxypeptidase/D-alanyl-D-alanine-endopeptidase [Nodularia sp. LEGE 04288]